MVRMIPITIIAALVGATPAMAQSEVAPRTAVSFVAGAGSSSSVAGVVLGGSALFDLNDRTSIEGQGSYLDRGDGGNALSVTGSLLVNLATSRKHVVPYLAAGGGAYRASFDLDNPRFLGPMASPVEPGTVVCTMAGIGMGPSPGGGYGPGTGACPAGATFWGAGQMDSFYARRLGVITVPAGGAWGTRSWIDPAVSLGGGVRFHPTDRVMLRPEVRALVVFANGGTHTVGVFGLNVGYRF